MKKIKYIIVLFVCIMLLGQYVNNIHADAYKIIEEGSISMSIRFDSLDKLSDVENRNIEFTLYQDERNLGSVSLNNIDNNNYNIKIEENTSEYNNETYINSYYLIVENLPFGEYQVEVSGDLHKTYLSEVLEIRDFSKHIEIGTGDSTFTFGDTNGDGVVDEKDSLDIQNAILGDDSSLDLSNDGQIDIMDLVLLEQNLITNSGAEILDTDLLNANKFVDEIVLNEDIVVNHPSGANAMMDNNVQPVVFENINSTISNEPLDIPVSFIEPLEIETIEIITGVGKGAVTNATIAVTYYDEFTNRNTTNEYHVSSENNRLLVDLKGVFEVSNIEVKITGVEDDVNYAMISQLSLSKIVPDNCPSSLLGAINNVDIVPDDESLEISFDEIEQVDGYTVFIGREPGLYDSSVVINEPYLLLEELENFSYYYIAIQAFYGDWTGQLTNEFEVVPTPPERFGEASGITTTNGDRSVTIEWNELDKATYYRILAKRKNQSDDEYVEVAYNVSGTSFTVEKLSNDVPYTFAVQACNDVLNSIVSHDVIGTPVSDGYELPDIPSYDRIDNNLIGNVSFIGDVNIHEDYMDLFKMENITDGSYHSYWTASFDYKSEPGFNFAFKQAVTMDYVMWVPRLDGDWISYLDNYFVRVQTLNSDGTVSSKKDVNCNDLQVLYDENGERYIALTFDKIENIISIEIGMYPLDQEDKEQVVSLSEIAFYTSNTFNEDIEDLFIDSARTDVVGGANSQVVKDLQTAINHKDRFVQDVDILNADLELALLYMNGKGSPGEIFTNLVSIATSYETAFIDYSPLGLYTKAGSELLIYANVPQGADISIISTSNGTTNGNFITNEYPLKDGKNVIKLPIDESGGSLYYRYSGTAGGAIHVYQETSNNYDGTIHTTPVLELYDMYNLTEEQVKDKITSYIHDLQYVITQLGDAEAYNIIDSTDISLRNILLTLPVSEIYNPKLSVPNQTNNLYNAILAWNELTEVLNGASGLDDIVNGRASRQYIRYMFIEENLKVLNGVIGVRFDYASNLVTGYSSKTSSKPNLYGFDVASTLGVALDSIGTSNITNQLYGFYGVTYDGDKGLINNGNINWSLVYSYLYENGDYSDTHILAMHWQLQQAYAGNTPYEFFGEFNKVLNSGIYNNYSTTDRIILAYCRVAGFDLTEFFNAWNMNLSNDATVHLQQMNLPIETNKIQYFGETERAYRLNGGTALSGSQTEYGLISSADVFEGTGRVWIWMSYKHDFDNVLGFEVYRNGEFISFSSEISYIDFIDMNKIEDFTYEIYLVDRSGKIHSTEDTIVIKKEDFK